MDLPTLDVYTVNSVFYSSEERTYVIIIARRKERNLFYVGIALLSLRHQLGYHLSLNGFYPER
jgi:hypothetical protein